MIFEKASKQDISKLTNLRIAYLQEDLGDISDEDVTGRYRNTKIVL